jgi:lipoprotein-anchoring transpeptidase ErfK/SrfK
LTTLEDRISAERRRRLERHRPPPSRRRVPAWAVVAGVACVLVLALLGGAYLYDRSHRDTIARGVRIDGVAVGGLDAARAQAKVRRAVLDPLRKPVVVQAGAQSWTLSPEEAQLSADVSASVARALAASREGSFLTRAARELSGGSVSREVALQVSYSHAAVRALTAKIRAAVERPAQNATVTVSGASLTQVPGSDGVAVDGSLGRRVEYALTGVSPNRTIAVSTHTVQPKVSTAQLASQYPAYIVVDRGAFQLHFYDHLRLAKTYPIAVGMQGLETPPGLYHVQWKEVDPPWIVPNKAWAGALAGKTIPPGPEDPLKARFMSFDGGAGIHGIAPSEYSSIGHDASHGCVRMTIPDVIALYSVTPVGTPVYII